jgi:hypothetical protein
MSLEPIEGRDSASNTSRRLLKFLQSPSSYPHRPAKIHLRETHASWVFIASPFVFKVKKPVALGFLDFSTLEKRRHFCRRELELNRRLCPDTYLAVMPIFEDDGAFSFDEDGNATIVEYALKMRELPHGRFLHELVAQGAIGEPEINRVVARLQQFYASETPTPEIEEWGRPQKLKISTDENFAQVEPFVRQTISPLAFEAIRSYTDTFYAVNAPLFEERIRQRRILDCHGDLRLEHVHITPDAVSIFDCIEFNDRFRFIDTANDLAFLAMDFDFEGRRDLANLLLRNAAREFDDAEMLKLANFYKCYRAVVRGKVESIQAMARHAPNADEHANRAARYFRLALRYAISGSEPLLVVVMGRIASGKSSLVRQLARELEWPMFSSDEIRKNLAGAPLTQRTAPQLRAEVYSEKMTQRTYTDLVQEGLAAVVKHGGAVIDATFSRRENRELMRSECLKAGVGFQVIEVHAPDEQIAARLRQREGRASEVSDARLEDFAKLNAAYEAPAEIAHVIGVSAAGEMAQGVRMVMLELAEKQSRHH